MNSKDFLKGRYLVKHNLSYYSIDITCINKKAFLFLGIDLGSRLIVFHATQEKRFNTQDVIHVLQTAFIPRNQGRSVVIHSDRESIFQANELKTFADNHKIVLSSNLAGRKNFGNQASESLNRSIKMLLRKELLSLLKNTPSQRQVSLTKYSLAQLSCLITHHELARLITQCVTTYNNKPHTSQNMYGLSPYEMDEALDTDARERELLRSTNEESADTDARERELLGSTNEESAVIAFNDNSPESLEIRKFRANVVEKHATNLKDFFIEHKKTSEETLDETIQVKRRLVMLQHTLYEDKRTLQKQNVELHQKIDFLVKDAQLRLEKDNAKQAAQLKRINAQKEQPCDYITPSEFEITLDIVKSVYPASGKTALTCARMRLAITLLYISGLRISTILLFRWTQLLQLINEGETQLIHIKGDKGGYPQTLHIGHYGQAVLKKVSSDVHLIQNSGNYHLQNFVFSAQDSKAERTHTHLHRVNFSKQVNSVLKHASVSLNKNLTSHSFRASFITDLLQSNVSIHKVKNIVAHKDIGSTAIYDRSSPTLKEVRASISKVWKARSLQHNIVRRKKKPKISKNRNSI